MSGRSTRRRSKTARAMEAEEQAAQQERATPSRSRSAKKGGSAASSASKNKNKTPIVKPKYLTESNGPACASEPRSRRSGTPASSRSSSRAASPASSSAATVSTRSSARRRNSTQPYQSGQGSQRSSTNNSSKRTSGANTPVSRASRSSSVASNGRGSTAGGGGGGGIPKLKLKTKLGRGYNPSLVNYKESEYHYGSDFEDDEEDDDEVAAESDKSSEESEDDMGDEASDDLDPESDIDLENIEAPSSLPQTPIPFWLREDEQVPPLQLPESSEDLLVPNKYLLKVFSVYEVLRRHHQILRLSPCRFEDFCAAIASEEQSNLLSEVHMSLLRALIRSEESNFNFGAPDQKDSIASVVFFMDSVTWPESLRAFLKSDPAYEEPLRIMRRCEYPFGGPADVMISNRVDILSFLCDQILATSLVRDFISEDGRLATEEHCRVCHRLGEMLVCDTCPGKRN